MFLIFFKSVDFYFLLTTIDGVYVERPVVKDVYLNCPICCITLSANLILIETQVVDVLQFIIKIFVKLMLNGCSSKNIFCDVVVKPMMR